MLSVNILHVTSNDLFHVRYNNQDRSCSLTSSNAENKLSHRKGMYSAESLKTDSTLIFYCPLMKTSRAFVQRCHKCWQQKMK